MSAVKFVIDGDCYLNGVVETCESIVARGDGDGVLGAVLEACHDNTPGWPEASSPTRNREA